MHPTRTMRWSIPGVIAAAALMLPHSAPAQVRMCNETPKPLYCDNASANPPYGGAVRGDRPSGWIAQGRSEVMAQHGIVATSQPLAAQAGLRILQKGGNAIDAAVATAAVLSLVEPMNVGIAADLFAIIYSSKDDKVYQLTSSGTAPHKASVEYYNKLGYQYDPANWGYGSGMPGGILSAPVPGAAWGWYDSVRRFGRLSLYEDLEPAIEYAENGFPVSEIIANGWRLPNMSACADATRPCDKKTNPLPAGTVWPDGWKGISCYNSASNVPANYPKCAFQDPDAIAAWYINGKQPVAGQIYKNPEYGKTLRLLGLMGLDGFYKGEVADAIVAKVRQLGGTMTKHDLANFKGVWVEAAHSKYKGYDVFESMAPSQAWNTGEMLNIIEACEAQWLKAANRSETTLAQLGPRDPLYWHLLVEAKKLSYKDLYLYNSDPDYTRLNGVPTNEFIQNVLLTTGYVTSNKLCDKVSVTTASNPTEGGNGPKVDVSYVTGEADTIYLTTADRWGNMVSWVNSNYAGFGRGIVVPGYGFPLANRLEQFTMNPTHPNRIDPGKRPYNTISAGFLAKNGVPLMTLGLMGGDMQVQGHAQMIVNIVDLGANLQASTDMARFYHNEVPNTLALEKELFAIVGPTLRDTYKHTVQNGASVGGYQAIMFTPTGPRRVSATRKAEQTDVLVDRPVNGFYRAGSDHRKDGQAAGW